MVSKKNQIHHIAGFHMISINKTNMACDIKFRHSILNLRSVKGRMSDTYWPISI